MGQKRKWFDNLFKVRIVINAIGEVLFNELGIGSGITNSAK